MISSPAEGELIGRAAAAAGLGAVVGIERALRSKASGVRTLSLVGLGACGFTIAGYGALSIPGADVIRPDPSRIAAQVVTGIGFLGAGAIFVSGDRIRGMTSAADIWLVAAVGVLCGVGLLLTAAAITAFGLVVVIAFTPLSRWLRAHGHDADFEEPFDT